MMATGKVQARGQVTLPLAVRRALGIKPGDVLAFETTPSGTVEVRVLSSLRLKDALERYRITEPVDEARDRGAWQDAAARDILGRHGD